MTLQEKLEAEAKNILLLSHSWLNISFALFYNVSFTKHYKAKDPIVRL